MNILKWSLITLTSLQLVGCGSAMYAVKTNSTANSCPTHVLRESFVLVYSMNIEVDGQTYAKLSDYTYAKFYVEPGKHTIKAAWPFLSGGVDLEVPYECNNAQAGYILFSGTVSGNKRYINARRLPEKEALARLGSFKMAGAN